MDKSLKRGMCFKFESRKICVAGNQCDNSEFGYSQCGRQEAACVPVKDKTIMTTIETKRESRFFCNCNSCDNYSYAFNFV